MKKNTLFIFPLLLVFYEVITYLSNDMYLPALPALAKDLGTTADWAQWTMTTWFLGAASTQLIFGPLSDRFGRRPILLGGGLLYIISTLACALSFSIGPLLVARYLQGIAVCSMVVSGYASIHELLEHDKAIHTLAWMSSITVLAPALGPMLGSVVLTWGSWRWIFVLLCLLGAVSIALLFKWMPESHPPEKRLPIHMKRLLTQYGAILKNRGFITNAVSFCLIFSGLIAWLAAAPFLIVDSFGYSNFVFGFCQALVFGGFIIGNRFVKFAMRRVGVRILVNIGLTIALIGGLSVALMTISFPHRLWALVCPLTVYALGAGLVFGPLQRLAIDASEEPMGLRMALFSNGMSLFGVLGSLLVGLLYNGKTQGLGILLCVFMILSAVIKWVLGAGSSEPETRAAA